MNNTYEKDVFVAGGGISGLASAHFLQKSNLSVLVMEKENRFGGSIQTVRKDGFLIEYGPNSTLDTSPIIHELFADVGIEDQMEYASEESNNRYIMRDGQLNALPMGPIAFLKTPHFSPAAKFRLLKEPFIKPSDPETEESLADFVIRRLGKEFLDYAIDPFVAGVYAGVPEELSVKSGFPKLYALEQKYGSLIKGAVLGARERKRRAEKSKQAARLFSFAGGMESMIQALTNKLQDSLLPGSSIRNIQRLGDFWEIKIASPDGEKRVKAGNILMTIPATCYGQLEIDTFEPIQRILSPIYHPPVTMVYFGYRHNPAKRALDGFGFLIPRKEKRNILGTIWSSTIFKNRAPESGIALTTFMGGTRQPENALLREENIINLVKNDLKSILGIATHPDMIAIKIWPEAIPQYNLGHQHIINQLELFEKNNPGLYISGNFRGGISVGDCIKQAKTMAESITKEQMSRPSPRIQNEIQT
ncbi:MAG: protoporphyrinogen oxidase [Calditrichaeota bacterium]|nr:protoporphyrinogen oxidase [Calditrichota bacterium]RQW08646.1 MAG: protoporphyrinogen oxidase [Calditrichota bacterium]